MKKVKVILIILVICLSAATFCGCSLFQLLGSLGNSEQEGTISIVDGYEVYSVKTNDKMTYAIIGVDDSNVINGVWTVPETVGDRAVSGLGYTKSKLMAGDEQFSLKENKNIKKVIVNHNVLLSDEAFVNLTELKDIQFNDSIDVYSDSSITMASIYSLTTTFSRNDVKKLYRKMPDLRCITLSNPTLTRSLELPYPSRIVAYFFHDSGSIVDTFSKYTSLSAFIVEDTVTEIDKTAFKDSTVDVYVRHTKENCPIDLQNGWDDGVNVIWGFEDEIIIFDSLFGSAITFETTDKNYVIAKIGEKIESPTAPTREGYVFTGWYKDYTCMERWDFETDRVSTSTVLVAGWQAI